MTAFAPCGPCSMGDHSNHDGTWHGTEGLIGGRQCACPGDCQPSDQVRAMLDLIDTQTTPEASHE